MTRKLQFFMLIMLGASFALAQNVTGVVKDNQDAPVVGATVVVKGSKIYTVTDIDGKFSFSAPKDLPFSIRINSTGYKVISQTSKN